MPRQAAIAIRPLARAERAAVDAVLPLHRLDRRHTSYLVAWDGDAPVGHVCIEWTEPPELQDLWVLPERRGEGIGSVLVAAVEREAAGRGRTRVQLSVGAGNERARRLYERLGYARTAAPPHRIKGPVMVRGKPLEVDDTLLALEKPVARRAAGPSVDAPG